MSTPVASTRASGATRSIRVGQRTTNWRIASKATGNCCPWAFWITTQRPLAMMTSAQSPWREIAGLFDP